MTPPTPSPLRPLLGLALILVVGVACVALAGQEDTAARLEQLREFGFAGALLVASLYLVTGLVGGPGTPVALATAYLFGFGPALAALIPLANAGSVLPFLLGRSLFAAWVDARVARRRRLRAMRTALAMRPVPMMILLRLSPVVPFSLVNYLASVSRISWGHYLLGTFLGTLPVLVLNAWIGASLSSLGQALGGEAGQGPAHVAVVAIGLVASVGAALLFTRNARQALARINA